MTHMERAAGRSVVTLEIKYQKQCCYGIQHRHAFISNYKELSPRMGFIYSYINQVDLSIVPKMDYKIESEAGAAHPKLLSFPK